MTQEFRNYVSKQLKSIMKDKAIVVTGYNMRVTLIVNSIIPPKSMYGSFRANVKVIKSERHMAQYDKEGYALRDENRRIIREWMNKPILRCDVNSFNNTIRSEVQYQVSNYLEIFGYHRWDFKVEKVAHLK